MDNNDLIWQNAKHHLEMLTTNFKYLEANSRNAASSDQPLVGPTSSSEDSRALARPEILAELVSKVEYEFETYLVGLPRSGISKEALVFIKDKVLQHLRMLDQGPVVQEPAFDWRRDPRVNATESQQSEA